MFKKSWQYLMLATVILGAMGPLGSVAAAEITAPTQTADIAKAADTPDQSQAIEPTSDDSQAQPVETTPEAEDAVQETPIVEQPTTESETPSVEQPEETPVVEEEPVVEAETSTTEEASADSQTQAVEPETKETVEETPVAAADAQPEPASKAVDSITIQTHDVVMFATNDTSKHALTATADVQPADSTDKVTWTAEGNTGNKDLVKFIEDPNNDRTIGYYSNHAWHQPTIINRDPDRAGLYVRYLQATAGNVTARKNVTFGGLRAITTTHENLTHEGLTYTMEAASSLPEGHAWQWEWKAMRANPANNTSNTFVEFGDYYGILNSTGTTGVNPTDQDFALTILPTSSFVQYMAELSNKGNGQPLALQLKVTSVDDPSLSYYTNFSTVAVTGYIDPGQLSLQSVPTMQEPAKYNGDDLRAGVTQKHELTGEINVLDSRTHPQDGTDAQFDRWHLNAKVSRFTADADPNVQLKFKFDLIDRDNSRITETLDSENSESTLMMTANESFKSYRCGIDVLFRPYESNIVIPTGSYTSTITWELSPATNSRSL